VEAPQQKTALFLMAKLSDLGLQIENAKIVFTGKPYETGIMSSDGEYYWAWEFLTPQVVGCSVDPLIEPTEFGEAHIRPDVIHGDLWVETDGGVTIPGWKIDFSKSHEVVLFQEKPISAWIRDNRKNRVDERRDGIRERLAQRRKP
jgi:hypothetical protein